MAQNCTHLDQIHEVTPSANGCEDCLKIGDSWVHLRLCLTCGHVGCCDSSKEQARNQAFPRDQPSDHSVLPAWRGLGLVLHLRAAPRACLSDS